MLLMLVVIWKVNNRMPENEIEKHTLWLAVARVRVTDFHPKQLTCLDEL